MAERTATIASSSGLHARPAKLFVQAVQAGQKVGLAAQDRGVQEQAGQRRDGAGAGGLVGEEAAQHGEQQPLVGEALGAEGADQAEDVVDAEVVGEPLVGDGVGEGSANCGQVSLEQPANSIAAIPNAGSTSSWRRTRCARRSLFGALFSSGAPSAAGSSSPLASSASRTGAGSTARSIGSVAGIGPGPLRRGPRPLR